MSLFDPQEVQRRTDAGIMQSYDAAPRAWKNRAYKHVLHLARTEDEFTTDEVIERLEADGEDLTNLMALGHVMKEAAKRGVIRNSGKRRKTKIPRRHRELTVWESLGA
jgi:hypothetical protein